MPTTTCQIRLARRFFWASCSLIRASCSDLQYLGQADQQGGVRDGQALLPLGNGLPDHMQTDGQIFLG